MISFGTCAGHAFTVLDALGIEFVEKVHENAVAHELRAGACLGEGRGPISCVTLWRQGALQRPGGRRVSRGRQATPNHLRVPRASALICVKNLACFCNPTKFATRAETVRDRNLSEPRPEHAQSARITVQGHE